MKHLTTLPRRSDHTPGREYPTSHLIHAPAKGATEKVRGRINKGDFNHAPRRERLSGISEVSLVNYDSIHAPRRERLIPLTTAFKKFNYFQSTLPRRERLSRSTTVKEVVMLFSTTLPKGATSMQRRGRFLENYFNPRSREGSDSRAVFCIGGVENFNPRSREGSDLIYCHSITGSTNHAPRRERQQTYNFFGVISEQNVHICILHYIFSRRINNHINKEINEFWCESVGNLWCFIFARIL